MLPDENFRGSVIIVTYGRSGSTLLQSLIQEIDRSHIVGENYGALNSLFDASQRAWRTKRAWGSKGHLPDHPFYGANDVRPKRLEKRLVRTFIDEFIQPPPEARWIGFKEIRYNAVGERFDDYMDFIVRNFPNPFIVFNSRDANDVAKSAWWKNWKVNEVHDLVETMDTRFKRYAEANPEYTFHAQFEETVSDPSSLKPLFEMLGESLDLSRVAEKLDKKLTH